MKAITVLGATGSIGMGALDVVRCHPDAFRAVALAVKSNAKKGLALAKEFGSKALAVEDEAAAAEIAAEARYEGVRVYSGPGAAETLVRAVESDMVLVSTVGMSGLKPTLAAIESGTTIALATKEVLVAAGEYVCEKAREKGVKILPVDSEHSAIFQCLQRIDPPVGTGRWTNLAGWDVDGLVLTASGGPFRNGPENLDDVTPDMALAHPNWKMGPKVTIDSATMMNKGFEILEARWLFDIPVGRIKTLVHPESIIHSMVTFTDGSTLAQLSVPDMRIPIQYAFTWPKRLPANRKELDLSILGKLSFYEPDPSRFPALDIVRAAAAEGGTATAAVSAADEVAVERFLKGEIRFTDIVRIVGSVLEKRTRMPCNGLDNILAADAEARRLAREA